MAVKKTNTEELKTYIVEKGYECFKVTVPAAWKVTFGPGIPPGQSARNYSAPSPWCLRFYETKENQRAFFSGVTSFRDESIQIVKKVVNVKSEQKSESTHSKSATQSEVVKSEEWVMD